MNDIVPANPYKSPFTAGLLSMICVSCGGQFYNGQYLKGAILLILHGGIYVGHLAVVGSTPLWILSIVDAVLIAKKLRSGRSVGALECF